MSDYIKLFDTVENQLEFLISKDYIQPHVSCTINGNNLQYNKYTKEDLELLNMPFTVEVLEEGEISWGLTNKTVYYSKNGGEWTIMTNETNIPVLEGDLIQFKGNNLNYSGNKFKSTAKFNAKGNIMSLIDGSDFVNANTIKANGFSLLFNDCTTLLSIKDLKLPATILEEYCYYSMFENCVNVKENISELPALTLSNCCYKRMFCGCSNLIDTPNLPALNLAESCYESMFEECSNLITVSVLPANKMKPKCYYSMFAYCGNLSTSPDLPALELAEYCYSKMFNGCSSLIKVPKILPATTLCDHCYHSMFYECISMAVAPILPALELAACSYEHMFWGCQNLIYVKALFLDIDSCTSWFWWMHSVARNGTFVKNSDAVWSERDKIPSEWTIITESV